MEATRCFDSGRFILIPQIIADGKAHNIKTLLNEHSISGPWDLLLWVALAMAGESINRVAIEKSLRRIRRRFIPDIDAFRIANGEDVWQEKLLDTFMTACELAFKLDLDKETILTSVDRILEALEGKQKRSLYSSDVYRLDGLLRCWLLKEAISVRATKVENFIAYLNTINPEPKPEKRWEASDKKNKSEIIKTDNKEVERLNKKIKALFPVYSTRLEILSCAKQKQHITDEQLNKLGSVDVHAYDFDYDHDSTHLRDTAAQSVMSLLIAENIEASELVKRASTLAKGRFSGLFPRHRQKILSRMCHRTAEAEKLVLLVAKAAEILKSCAPLRPKNWMRSFTYLDLSCLSAETMLSHCSMMPLT